MTEVKVKVKVESGEKLETHRSALKRRKEEEKMVESEQDESSGFIRKWQRSGNYIEDNMNNNNL